jgi:hypothetical protein
VWIVGHDVRLGTGQYRYVALLQPDRVQPVADDPAGAANEGGQGELRLVADVQAPRSVQDGQVEHPAPGPGGCEQIVEDVHAEQPS